VDAKANLADASGDVDSRLKLAEEPSDVPEHATDTEGGRTELLTGAERDRLVRVLDRRLLVLALAALLGDDAQIPAIAEELGLTDAASLEVAMKLAVDATGGVDASTLESLRALGVRVEDEVAARGLVVARLAPQQLVKVALVAGVKRVEPIMRRD
jgi:hypothetical protein